MSESTDVKSTKLQVDPKDRWNYNIQKWDLIFKSITTLSLIFGSIWALMEYFDKKDQEFNARQREYQFMLYKERKETLYPLCNAAAEIATSTSLKEAQKAIRTFETLWAGEVGIIDEGEIAQATEAFIDNLIDYKNGPEGSSPPFDLIEQSTQLSIKCKQVLDLRKVYGLPDSNPGKR